jgi:diacylglycerol O-acyltransferase-1
MPSVVEATASIDRLEPWHILERLLYVAMPVTYLWLLMFYLIFHLFLNLLAELLRFGDRVFYKDWWNATTFEEYWRLWNLPVHYWMVIGTLYIS